LESAIFEIMFDAVNFILQLFVVQLGILSFTLLLLVGWKFHLKQFNYAVLFLLPSFLACFMNFLSDYLQIFRIIDNIPIIVHYKYYITNVLAYILIPYSIFMIVENKIRLKRLFPFLLIAFLFISGEVIKRYIDLPFIHFLFPVLNIVFGVWVIYLIFRNVPKVKIPILQKFLLFAGWFNITALVVSMFISLFSFSFDNRIFDAVYFIPICSAAFAVSAVYFFKPMNIDPIKISDRIVELYGISEREREVINYVLEGFTAREISDKVFLSHQVVKNYLSKIYKKVSVKNKMELISIIRQDRYPI